VHSSFPCIVIKNANYDDGFARINDKVGKIYDVFKQRSFSLISQKIYKVLGMDNEKYHDELRDNDDIFVNWTIYSKIKNEDGRLPLFIASEQSIKWSDSVCEILEGNGGAIEDADVNTGLEAFMLAGVGRKSDMETVFKLLQDHPAAINPYVRKPQHQKVVNKKRKFVNTM